MMKELYMVAHDRLIEEYLEAHPDASEHDAYEKTADAAYGRMTDMWADMIDDARQREKDRWV